MKNRSRSVAVGLAVSMAVGAGVAPAALAAPGEQGGTTPSAPAPGEQGGTTPSAPGEQGGTTPPAPEPVAPGPGIVPGPPSGQWQNPPAEPIYNEPYNPMPSGPLHAPRYVPPVKRIAPPPETLRVGTAEIPTKLIPDFPQKDAAVNSGNAWSAYWESEIARGLISIGVPPDEASRKAAATIAGAVAGGVIVGSSAFLVTTVTVGLVTVPIGTLVGAGVGAGVGGGNPLSTAGGAALGAGGGAAVALGAGTAAGLLGLLAGAAGGGTLGYLFGAGDPGKSKTPPRVPWDRGGRHRLPDVTSSTDNQYELRIGQDEARAVGLPPVEYVVRGNGDVQAAAQIGGQTYTVGWSADQAAAPIEALGAAAPAARKAIDDAAQTISATVQTLVPGASVTWGAPKVVKR